MDGRETNEFLFGTMMCSLITLMLTLLLFYFSHICNYNICDSGCISAWIIINVKWIINKVLETFGYFIWKGYSLACLFENSDYLLKRMRNRIIEAYKLPRILADHMNSVECQLVCMFGKDVTIYMVSAEPNLADLGANMLQE